jgi:diaminohydroxyphosphoribosylaminopyrimidine deaminase/5-amino-6-(5-phosphoribosylamino)uracil reductase
LDSSGDVDQRLMSRANHLAKRGWGRTYPNPLVGAVVARNGEIVGLGAHEEFGGPHAEAIALADAGDSARGATLYVTLEPCTHTGKQPPCTDAIVAAGIARAVIAVRDPDPIAAGGAEQLRRAGIDVEVGLLGPSAARRNFRFLHRFQGDRRPYVAIKLAVSMDGRIADAKGRSKWISNDVSRKWAHWLRAGFGALAVGGDTAVVDGARLTVRGAIQPRIAPLRVVFDRRGRVRPGHSLFEDAGSTPLAIIVGSAVPPAHRDAVSAAGAQVLVADALAVALAELHERGVDSVLVEGGGRLAGALLREGLVDRVYQIQSPLWLGDGAPAWQGLGSIDLESARRWRVVDVQPFRTKDDEVDVLTELER